MDDIRPIDANELKDSIVENIRELGDQCSPVMLTMFGLFSDIIENAPTIDTTEKYNDGYEKGYKHGYKDGQNSGRPQGDLISRSELKKALEPIAKQMNDSLYGDGIYRALKEIDNAPTVEERPQGEWVRYRDNPHQPEHIKCSNCGQYWSIADHDKTFDFCFKCGAEMRDSKE